MACNKLTEWIQQEEEEGTCRPCAIAALTGMYSEKLDSVGHTEGMTQINAALMDEKDPLGRACEAMDSIKENVVPELRQELEAYDCMAQNNKI